jgi:hypothetical protein
MLTFILGAVTGIVLLIGIVWFIGRKFELPHNILPW